MLALCSKMPTKDSKSLLGTAFSMTLKSWRYARSAEASLRVTTCSDGRALGSVAYSYTSTYEDVVWCSQMPVCSALVRRIYMSAD